MAQIMSSFQIEIAIMKKILMPLIALMLAWSQVAAQSYTLKNLKGRWESSDGGGIEILDSNKVYLIYGSERKLVDSFQADFSKSPCWFDLSIKSSAEKIDMKTLLLIVNEDLLQWQIFENDRPDHFSAEKGEMVYLRRKK
jgi:hypothetical protein